MSGRTTQATHVGVDTKIAGTVSGSDSLSVAGAISGDVNLDGDLAVATSGVIEGDVEATNVALDGELRGKLTARAAVVGAQAKMTGTISSPRVTINPRARLDARFDMPLSLPRGVAGRR